ncbi:DUF6895 family protein [Hyalangium versicolor]|uniref:DUF6895 family protein n=1 Tax=Hyalangium versicolor TaxID=2861190 RepID=UPI001CCFC503|nr:hypothetical protein [Hyalangium versicolor]
MTRDASTPARVPLPSREAEARRALQAMLALTASGSEQDRALRALILHMLEGYTPRAFARWQLAPLLEEAVQELESISREFPRELTADDALARVDAVYLLHVRKRPCVLPECAPFTDYLLHLDETGDSLYAWLLCRLMQACGLPVPLVFPERPFKEHSRLLDLYWVTHLYLLDTRYLHGPLRSPEAPTWTAELLESGSWLLEQGHLDLAGEVALCLQVAGQGDSDTCRMILDALAREQQPDGRVLDSTLGETPGEAVAHTTAVALIAFAVAEEQSGAES